MIHTSLLSLCYHLLLILETPYIPPTQHCSLLLVLTYVLPTEQTHLEDFQYIVFHIKVASLWSLCASRR